MDILSSKLPENIAIYKDSGKKKKGNIYNIYICIYTYIPQISFSFNDYSLHSFLKNMSYIYI